MNSCSLWSPEVQLELGHWRSRGVLGAAAEESCANGSAICLGGFGGTSLFFLDLGFVFPAAELWVSGSCRGTGQWVWACVWLSSVLQGTRYSGVTFFVVCSPFPFFPLKNLNREDCWEDGMLLFYSLDRLSVVLDEVFLPKWKPCCLL